MRDEGLLTHSVQGEKSNQVSKGRERSVRLSLMSSSGVAV